MYSHLKMKWAAQYTDWAPLFLRIAVGLILFVHGYQKLGMGVEGVSGFLASLGFPMAGVFAVILIAVEVLGGIALIVGAWTRLAAFLASIVAVVALFTVHFSKGFLVSNGGYEFILLILAVSVSLLIIGAGKFSVDHNMKLG